MIKIEDLSYRYKGTKQDALSNLTLQLETNKICGLLGKNGVGKSTMLYLIAGLLRPSKGSVKTLGFEARERNVEMLQDVFILTEEFDLPKVTLKEFVKINKVFYPNFSDELLSACLKEFELDSVEEIHLSKLSMGQKKKVYMSFALATNTRILLMDEPTNGLDIPSKAQFRKVISRGMSEDRLIIVSTHQVHDVDQLLDHVVILSNEGVLLNESVEQITDKYVFEYRTPDDMDDVIYAEPSIQGNAVMAPRGNKPETQLNLELLFDAVIKQAQAPL